MLATAMSAVGRKFTYANVASSLALVVALGTGTAYAANTVRSGDIVDGQVKAPDLGARAVSAPKIRTGAVNSAKVADGTLTTDDIADGTVTADDLGTDSVKATEIADDSIDGGEIFNNSLTALDLASSSVGASEIADSSITGTDIASNSISTSDLVGADVSGAVSLSGVPNGRCSQVSLGVSGAQVGQTVMVSTNGAIQNGVFLYANRVSAAGTVEASICNFSGTSMTPISGLAVRVITFG